MNREIGAINFPVATYSDRFIRTYILLNPIAFEAIKKKLGLPRETTYSDVSRNGELIGKIRKGIELLSKNTEESAKIREKNKKLEAVADENINKLPYTLNGRNRRRAESIIKNHIASLVWLPEKDLSDNSAYERVVKQAFEKIEESKD